MGVFKGATPPPLKLNKRRKSCKKVKFYHKFIQFLKSDGGGGQTGGL